MPRHRDVLDRQPGSLPEIREHVDGLTFVMRPPGLPKTARLVIRSDDAGDLWLSILSDLERDDRKLERRTSALTAHYDQARRPDQRERSGTDSSPSTC